MCRELGIGIVAYSPLGRGFFSTGPQLVENLSKDDIRKVCRSTTQMMSFKLNYTSIFFVISILIIYEFVVSRIYLGSKLKT